MFFYDFISLSNRIYAVTQLGFGQGSEHVYSWVFEGGYFYYGHMDILFLAKVKKEYRPEQSFFLYLCQRRKQTKE